MKRIRYCYIIRDLNLEFIISSFPVFCHCFDLFFFVLFRLIQHAKDLLTQTDESLCLRIMHALKSMVKSNHEFDTRVHTKTKLDLA